MKKFFGIIVVAIAMIFIGCPTDGGGGTNSLPIVQKTVAYTSTDDMGLVYELTVGKDISAAKAAYTPAEGDQYHLIIKDKDGKVVAEKTGTVVSFADGKIDLGGGLVFTVSGTNIDSGVGVVGKVDVNNSLFGEITEFAYTDLVNTLWVLEGQVYEKPDVITKLTGQYINFKGYTVNNGFDYNYYDSQKRDPQTNDSSESLKLDGKLFYDDSGEFKAITTKEGKLKIYDAKRRYAALTGIYTKIKLVSISGKTFDSTFTEAGEINGVTLKLYDNDDRLLTDGITTTNKFPFEVKNTITNTPGAFWKFENLTPGQTYKIELTHTSKLFTEKKVFTIANTDMIDQFIIADPLISGVIYHTDGTGTDGAVYALESVSMELLKGDGTPFAPAKKVDSATTTGAFEFKGLAKDVDYIIRSKIATGPLYIDTKVKITEYGDLKTVKIVGLIKVSGTVKDNQPEPLDKAVVEILDAFGKPVDFYIVKDGKLESSNKFTTGPNGYYEVYVQPIRTDLKIDDHKVKVSKTGSDFTTFNAASALTTAAVIGNTIAGMNAGAD